MYYEVTIVPSHSGFGEYQSLPINDEGWEDEADLLAEITSNSHGVFELTDEIVATVLPGQAEDIRGRIHNEPDRVFAAVDGFDVRYFGITER